MRSPVQARKHRPRRPGWHCSNLEYSFCCSCEAGHLQSVVHGRALAASRGAFCFLARWPFCAQLRTNGRRTLGWCSRQRAITSHEQCTTHPTTRPGPALDPGAAALSVTINLARLHGCPSADPDVSGCSGSDVLAACVLSLAALARMPSLEPLTTKARTSYASIAHAWSSCALIVADPRARRARTACR